MDVFKLDLDQAQIGSSLVESSSANNTIQRNLHTATGSAGNGSNNNNLHAVDEDDDEVLPEVSFDANSDFNLHFFDTPEDSSTQGGFSDAGSVESETEAFLESPLLTGSGLHSQLTQQQQTHTLTTDCQKFYQSSTSVNLNPRTLNHSVNANNNLISTVAPSSSSSSFTQFGNGGSSLYATNNIHNFTQSNSSSSGCSSTSSVASNSSSICGSSSSHNNNNGSNSHNNGPISGNNRITGSSTISSSSTGSLSANPSTAAAAAAATSSSSLVTEHFIGNLNHTTTQSSTVSSSIASLANVKLASGRTKKKNVSVFLFGTCFY